MHTILVRGLDVRNSYKHLNPISGGLYRGDGTSSIEPQVVDEFLRGAVISVLSIWLGNIEDTIAMKNDLHRV